ncbi:hypothetical protein RAH42_12895 [Pyramidobacter sp. YE332]|uniref:hypothetical protein n=1 Tax=Pyramidobacter sp. YE332 TaxID=3068894 RepID=UPI00294AEA26|nr:hypothetical protein [Pyramidobacter sp. YE332]WOL40015.1 hypothetical protein RAH42_12895 [Pyramidobacter sp. YE332]
MVTGAYFTENECMAGYVAALGMGIEGMAADGDLQRPAYDFPLSKARAQDDEDRIEGNERTKGNERNERNERNEENEGNEAGKESR